MAYKITRKPRIKEDLELCNPDGSTALTIPVDIDVDVMGGRIRKAYGSLAEAQKKITADSSDLEAYGGAVVTLFACIFGEDGTAKMLTFYQENYTEMLLDVFPFIQNVILPRVAEVSQQRKKEILQNTRAVQMLGYKKRSFFS